MPDAGLWEAGSAGARARELYLTGASGLSPVRSPILASWDRCRDQGLSPEYGELPYRPDLESEELLLRAAAPVLERLHGQLLDTRVCVLLTDATARVLDRRAGDRGLNRHLDRVQAAPGFSYAEDHAGTNGIGTALSERRPFAVIGSEHFAERLQLFACAGAPVLDPVTGELRGIVDLTSWHHEAHPLMAALAREAALGVELRLLEQYAQRERARAAVRARRTVPPPRSLPVTAEMAEAAEESLTGAAHAARQRLALLCEAGVRIGTSLELDRTAEELAEVAVPGLAGLAAVDLAEWALAGEEQPPAGPLRLRRTALRARTAAELTGAQPVGTPVHYRPGSAAARCLAEGLPVAARENGREVLAVPVRARAGLLGVAVFERPRGEEAFLHDDLTLAEELVARAALCLDNGRRFAREHALALTLQRSLLPRALPEQHAVDVAHRYLPAQAGVGGDWFDVVPLSGARVALVVGDVVGHGLHAAATMGRLRTAVRNFAALDLPPEDLLAQLDALVDSMDQEEAADSTGSGVIGATCLYVVHDPVTRRCTMASAGHPLPALVAADGTVAFPGLPTGPPLGLGSTPYESRELELPEDTRLVLYTDGLIEDRGQDIDAGLLRLAAALTGPPRSPEQLCAAVVRELLPQRPSDDVALLVARTLPPAPDRVASWPVPPAPESVAGLRAAVVRQLYAWGLEDLAFATELMVSELVTNAIRHGAAPAELRLIRDRALICEVADSSSVSPRLRRARSEDEGGRGLFLVAQLAQRWGTRYTPTGKVIWCEQPLPARSTAARSRDAERRLPA